MTYEALKPQDITIKTQKFNITGDIATGELTMLDGIDNPTISFKAKLSNDRFGCVLFDFTSLYIDSDDYELDDELTNKIENHIAETEYL